MASKVLKRPFRQRRVAKPKQSRHRVSARAKIPVIQPAADAKLKKVFANIGVPEAKPFRPDPFQLKALDAVSRHDCLVCVPTGAGKTWVAQKAMERIHDKGGRCWYASPLKALSNAKYIEFGQIFGSNQVGILTGDRKENPTAPIIVGTTEILRNQLYDAMHRGETMRVDLVVLDEAHFLGDPDRGVVWEEIMIYLPARIPLLLLSATVGNAQEISKWLCSIRKRKCRVIEEFARPVPLYPIFFHPSGKLFPFMPGGPEKRATLHKKVMEFLSPHRSPRFSKPGKPPPYADILRVLRRYNLLPAIFFLKSRADCNAALDQCEDNTLKDENRRAAIQDQISRLTDQSPHVARHRQRWHIENLAVGAHHSGQIPAWKMVIENLMSQGLLDAVFATSTVAAGVNFPARTIVLQNSDRFNGKEFLPLSPTEFHQMTGRAGRRGMDQIGFALIMPGRYMDLAYVASLIDAPPSNVDSRLFINFSMVLNLLLSHTVGQVEDLLSLSFAQFQRRGKTQKASASEASKPRLWFDFLKHLHFLKSLAYVAEDNRLTEAGIWASHLRVDQPLQLAEGIRLGLFPLTNPALLAAIVASFVYDKEGDESIGHHLVPDNLLRALETVALGLEPLFKMMVADGFSVRPMLIKPAAVVYAWANNTPWGNLCRSAGIQEGDLSMLILRTADHLRHIRTLKDIFPKIAGTANDAIDLIVKDPVITNY